MQPPKKAKQTRRRRLPGAGRPTILTVDLTLQIKELVVQGFKYNQVQKKLGIAEGTWNEWVMTNYHGFRDNLYTYTLERKLRKAEKNLEEVLDMETKVPVIGMFGPVVDKKTKKVMKAESEKLLKIKSDVSVFVAETIGRKSFSKKIEVDDVSKKKLIILKDGTGKGNV